MCVYRINSMCDCDKAKWWVGERQEPGGMEVGRSLDVGGHDDTSGGAKLKNGETHSLCVCVCLRSRRGSNIVTRTSTTTTTIHFAHTHLSIFMESIRHIVSLQQNVTKFLAEIP